MNLRDTNPEKDWPEDFDHENGMYYCRCIHCKDLFIGYKRRAVCKLCSDTSVVEKPDPKDVKIGRLQRKIEKLTQQRDHYKQKHDYYANVISMQPYLERRWTSFEERRKEQERIKGLEARVKEQEQLIKILNKGVE